MTRTFYVDAAHSITSKVGKKYWKCSVVENQQNLINFANSKAIWSIEAEAYAVLKTVFWLVEQKEQGEIRIFTDCLPLIKRKFYEKLLRKVGEKQQRTVLQQIKRTKKTKASYFIQLAKLIAQQNSIKLKLRWIRGSENPADYYSRWNHGKYQTPICSEKG